MATEKSFADLLQDLVNDIQSATDPDSITPEILFQRLSDIIKSCWNKIDGITIDGLTIPDYFNDTNHKITNGDKLNDDIQKIINAIDSIYQIQNGSTMIQGRSGLFLATEHETNKQIITVPAGVTATFDVTIPQDYGGPGFDNGNYWSTFDYRNKDAAFAGTFYLGSVEIEIVNSPTSGPVSIEFKIVNESGATLAAGAGATIPLSSDGDKKYPKDINTGVITVPQTTGKVKVQLVFTNAASVTPTVIQINKIRFRNED